MNDDDDDHHHVTDGYFEEISQLAKLGVEDLFIQRL